MESDAPRPTVAELEFELERLREECRRQEALQMEWTGNLGRWQWEVATNQVTFNPWKVRALGYGEHEVAQPVGFEFFTELLHPDDHERVMENMRQHLFGRSDAYEVEYRVRAKDGTWRWYFDRGVISKRCPRGEPLVVSGIVFDISERMRLEAELRLRNQELADLGEVRTRFLALLAHDLKGSLGGVVKVLDLLRDHCFDANEEGGVLNAVTESAHLTFELLENLLQWSSVQTGQRVLSLEPTPLVGLVTRAVAQTSAQALAKGLKVETTWDGELVSSIDPEAGQTVVRNLLVNALKFSAPGGGVEVDLHRDGSWATITVTDHGVGIDADHLASLFVPGQSSTLGTQGERGTGLGLVLCRELVERCGGCLSAESTPGQGSRFAVRLPLVS